MASVSSVLTTWTSTVRNVTIVSSASSAKKVILDSTVSALAVRVDSAKSVRLARQEAVTSARMATLSAMASARSVVSLRIARRLTVVTRDALSVTTAIILTKASVRHALRQSQVARFVNRLIHVLPASVTICLLMMESASVVKRAAINTLMNLLGPVSAQMDTI